MIFQSHVCLGRYFFIISKEDNLFATAPPLSTLQFYLSIQYSLVADFNTLSIFSPIGKPTTIFVDMKKRCSQVASMHNSPLYALILIS